MDGLWNGFVWVHSFGRGNHNGFNTNERERSIDESTKEGEKVTSRSSNTVVVRKGSRVFPISESDAIVIWCSPKSDDKGNKDKS